MKDLLSRLRYWIQFFPFRINFFVLLIVLVGIKLWIKQSKTETSSFYEILTVMAKISFVLLLLSIIISFLSVFTSWLYFMIKNPLHGKPGIDLIQRYDSRSNYAFTETVIHKAIRPIFGYVKMKLQYGEDSFTQKFSISFKSNRSWIPFKCGLLGINSLWLSEVRTYHFNKGILYFEDLLRLFSFAYPCSLQAEISNLPKHMLEQDVHTSPKETKQDTVRIEQLRRIQGDYTNYKSFESNDDVRRVIWKIFAKSKELVVRTPEPMDRYSSHIIMFSSFYVEPEYLLFPRYTKAMLNRYKHITWTIYKALMDKEFQVRLELDQEVHLKEDSDYAMQRLIAELSWQSSRKASDVFKPAFGSVLCLHSMSSLEDVRALIESLDKGTHVFFIKLSRTFKSLYVLNWLSYLFFKPKTDELSELKRGWMLTPIRYKLIKNEHALLNMLHKSDFEVEII